MATLYPNYIVIVQESESPYAPNNDLEVLLYEGRVELKTDPSTGSTGVFDYGTSVSAVPVRDREGSPATAIATDSTNKPGEYKFVGLDLNYSGSLSESGETLYSVVGRPASDTALNSFDRAKILQDRIALTDPNTKQAISGAIGEFSNISENIVYAGGSVLVSEFSAADGTSSTPSKVFLELSGLSDSITSSEETPSGTPPSWVGGTSIIKLVARAKAHYTNGSTDTAIWESIPIYKTTSGKYVIKIAADIYNIYKSKDIGSGGIELNGIWQDIIVSTSLEDYNIRIKPSSDLPDVSSDFAGYDEDLLLTAKKDSIGYQDRVLYYLNSYGNDYNWNQVLSAPIDSADTDYTHNPNRSKAILADGSNTFTSGVINYRKWWSFDNAMRLLQGNVEDTNILFGIQSGDTIDTSFGDTYSDIPWNNLFGLCISDYTSFSGEVYIGVGGFDYTTTDRPEYNIDIKGDKGVKAGSFGTILSADRYLGLYPYSSGSPTIESGYDSIWATGSGLKYKTNSGTVYDILVQSAGVSNHTIASHSDTSATGSYLDALYGSDGLNGVVGIGSDYVSIDTPEGKNVFLGGSDTTTIYRDDESIFYGTTNSTEMYGIDSDDYIKIGTISGDSHSIVANANTTIKFLIGGSNSIRIYDTATEITVANGDTRDYVIVNDSYTSISSSTRIKGYIGTAQIIDITSSYCKYYGPTGTTSSYLNLTEDYGYFSSDNCYFGVSDSQAVVQIDGTNTFDSSISGSSYTKIQAPGSSYPSITVVDAQITLNPGNDPDRKMYISSDQIFANHNEKINLRVNNTNIFYGDTDQTRLYKTGTAFLVGNDSLTRMSFGSVDSSTKYLDINTNELTVRHDVVTVRTEAFVVCPEALNSGDGNLVRIADKGSIKVSVEAFGTGTAEEAAIYLKKSGSNTVGTKTTTQDTEILGKIYFQGVNTNNAFASGAWIEATQTGSAGAEYCDTKLVIASHYGDTSTYYSYIEFDGSNNKRVSIGDNSPAGSATNPKSEAEYGYVTGIGQYYWRIPETDSSPGAGGHTPDDGLKGHMMYYNGDLYYWDGSLYQQIATV